MTPSQAMSAARTARYKPSVQTLSSESRESLNEALNLLAIGALKVLTIMAGFLWALIAYFLAASSRQTGKQASSNPADSDVRAYAHADVRRGIDGV